MKTHTSLQEINSLQEWAIDNGWALEAIPPRSAFEVLRLSKDGVLAIYYSGGRDRYTTFGPGRDLLLQWRTTQCK